MSADDLDILDPPSGTVTFRGERLEIRPLTLGQLPMFSRLVRPVVAEFFGDRHPAWLENDELMVDELFELHGEAIVEAAAIATGKPVEFIAGNTDASELLLLANRIVEVNRDFFIRAAKAAQAETLRASQPTTVGGRPTSSSSSDAVIH